MQFAILTGMGYTIRKPTTQMGEDMKLIMIAIVLLLSACNKTPSSPPPKIAEQQREVLEKAKEIEQTLQKNSDAEKKKIDEAAAK